MAKRPKRRRTDVVERIGGMKTGAFLRWLRGHVNVLMTQRELAEALGLGQATVGTIEATDRPLYQATVDRILAFAQERGVTVPEDSGAPRTVAERRLRERTQGDAGA